MAKRKSSLTLIEVIDREGKPSGGSFTPPRWWRGLGVEEAESERVQPDAGEAEGPESRFAGLLRGIVVRITPLGLGVGAGAMLVLLFITFQLGVRAGNHEKPPMDTLAGVQTIEQVQKEAARPDSLNVMLGRNAPRPAPVEPEPESRAARWVSTSDRPPVPAAAEVDIGPRQPGRNYIVVESFKAEARADAGAARKYLHDNGIGTTVEASGNRLLLITTQGFDAGDGALSAMCGRIERLGEAYFQQGGRYRFKGCYGKLLTDKGW